MKRILKWSVQVDNAVHDIGGGPVVRAECQYGPDSVQVWTCEVVDQVTTRRVKVVGTGQMFPDQAQPIATALAAEGRLVWHVIDLGDSK